MVKSKLLCILNFLDFNRVCNIIINNNEKYILKCQYTHKKKLSDLFLGYQVNPTRFSHHPNKVSFNSSSHILTEDEKSLLYNELRSSISPEKNDYADFLTQFEFSYRDTIMFKMKFENRKFLKNKLKDIFFSTLRLHNFNKVEEKLSEVESLALKNLAERKNLVIQKADKGNTLVITVRTKYLERIKSSLSLLVNLCNFPLLKISGVITLLT